MIQITNKPLAKLISLDSVVVFYLSLCTICLELFFTNILNLKTWNHVVYVIIPFAILGYGIGANIYLVFSERINKLSKQKTIAYLLFLLAFLCVASTTALVNLPIYLSHLKDFFNSFDAVKTLLISYTIVLFPFVIIGFLIVYIFSLPNQEHLNKLYFWDLVGAGFGAVLYFFAIHFLEIFHSVIVLSVLLICLGIKIAYPKKNWLLAIILLLSVAVLKAPEPIDYKIDKTKGINWIPGILSPFSYQTLVTKWSPLGRTDCYRIKESVIREKFYESLPGTFELNVLPRPEFSYFATNFLAGTPAFKLSEEGLKENSSQLQLFSQPMEFPYLLFDQPKVVVIGTGGGRDIFFAKTHGAKEIVGAEINPVIYSEMSENGKLYNYTGKIYRADGVKVFNVDGRHLVKTLMPESYDLVVLNGVDTFSGLFTGAYAYAESYLYTKNAVLDYLKIINDHGVINFNRWFFPDKPRETFRLFVMALDALKTQGAEEPWRHLIIGYRQLWGMTLIKKTPFTGEEISKIKQYFDQHGVEMVYPSSDPKKKVNYFELYVMALRMNQGQSFIEQYPFDISVVSDDKPFFYKYYKLKDFDFKQILLTSHPVTGTIVFLSQIMVLIHSLIFIVLFILLPLYVFRKEGVRKLLGKDLFSFILFFGCIGLGYMFIEIPMMQRFTLLLGSPVYSISITLASLLIFTGIGSFFLDFFRSKSESPQSLVSITTFILIAYLVLLILLGSDIFEYFMKFAFAGRVLIVALSLLPLGLCLGIYFPSALLMIRGEKGLIAWAWGINLGFTVSGSILAIMLGQFFGFSLILKIAAVLYLLAAWAFKSLSNNKAFLKN